MGAHLAYGWMPRMLVVDSGGFVEASHVLNEARQSSTRRPPDGVKLLPRVINRSVVGVSRLLHFLRPSLPPIWDSNVRHYLVAKKVPIDGANTLAAYERYLGIIDELTRQKRAQDVTASISGKPGYRVTRCRTIELVVFVNGRQ